MDLAPRNDAYVAGWGPGVIGYIFALWMSGISAGQMGFYLKAFVNDYRGIKAVVILVFVLDLFHTYCTSVLFWKLLVLPWEMVAGILLSSTICVIVQCFYAHRVWTISDKNWKLTGSVLVTALGQYGLGIGAFALFGLVLWAYTQDSIVQSNNGNNVRWLFLPYELENTQGSSAKTRSAASFFTCPFEIPYAAASAICDVTISVSFLFYLRPARSGIKRTNNHIQQLVVVSVQMGVITSLVAIVWFLLYFTQGARYWTGFPSAILCKLNVNSMLAVLNARKSIRNQSKEQVTVLPTIPMIHVTEASALS